VRGEHGQRAAEVEAAGAEGDECGQGGEVDAEQRDPGVDVDRAEAAAGSGAGKAFVEGDAGEHQKAARRGKPGGLFVQAGQEPEGQGEFEFDHKDQKMAIRPEIRVGQRFGEQLVPFQDSPYYQQRAIVKCCGCDFFGSVLCGMVWQ